MKNKFSFAMTLAVIMSMLFNSLALADNLQGDDLNTNGNTNKYPGQTGTAQFHLIANGSDGCNADSSNPVTVSISSSQSWLTIGSSASITACGSANAVTIAYSVASNAPVGSVAIIAGVASGGKAGNNGFNNNPGDFTVTVIASPDGTAPVITPNVSGTLGSNGWYVSNVGVSWTVTDPQSSITSSSGCGSSNVTADTAGTTFTCSATSAGGTSSQSVTIKRDATAPSISGGASPAPNLAGWNNTDVNVTFTCNDGTSGVASCGPNTTLTNNGENQSASGNAVDNAGNTASATVSNIDIDKELPSIVASVPTPNANNWYNGSVTATFDCDDLYSGVASCEGPHTFSAEGSSSFTGNATDVAENANSTNVSVMIDTVAPVIALVSRTPANGNGWNNSNVDLEWSCTDEGGSGVVAATINKVVSAEGEDQSESATCEDLAGNTASDTQIGINIDLTLPTASAGALPAPNGAGWNNSNVTVSFSGSDDLSGIDFCDAAIVLSSEGAGQSASGSCTDNAGNVSTLATASGINIDLTAPTASVSASPAPNGNGWNNSAVTVSFDGNDALSGLASCDEDVVLNTEGAGQSASGSCTDIAGNESTPATASGINIDLTAPSVSLVGGPANGGSYYFGSVPAAPTCTATDVLSGLATPCSVSGYSTAVGSRTVTASATDKAGNSASASASYSVLAWTPNGFFQPVDMNGVWNTIKGGQTVPLKFEIFAGSTELTNTSAVQSVQAYSIACTAGGGEDAIETVTTGGTSLRYDATSGQFIFNWQTPRQPGTCYKVVMTAQDGSSITAFFKLK